MVEKGEASSRLNAISRQVVNAALIVHSALGPGLLESVYQECLKRELIEQGLSVSSEVYLPVYYRGELIDMGFRLDLLVESELVLELKSVVSLSPVHVAQLLTYLKLSDKRLGLLINFNVAHLREGLKRVVNGL